MLIRSLNTWFTRVFDACSQVEMPHCMYIRLSRYLRRQASHLYSGVRVNEHSMMSSDFHGL